MMNKTLRNLACAIVAATSLFQAQPTAAVAYCALRDPIEAIRFLYPQADTHRSIVRAIDNAAREQILQSLSFSLHFNELGKHTLYTILDGKTPVGFAHVRSELAPWGLMEVAWALAPDLTIKNFMFQRCRSAICSPETIEEILTLLTDKSLDELKAYLSPNGETLTPEAAKLVNIDNDEFVAAMIRSALKTIAVTSITWADEINAIQHDNLSHTVFNAVASQVKQTPVGETALAALKQHHNGGGSILQTASVAAYQLDDGGNTLGYVASGRWHDNQQVRTTYWAFDAQGRVLETRTVPKFSTQSYQASFTELNGLDVSSSENCSTATQLMAHDLYFLASFKGQ